jgi:hypothetical protein
LIYTVASFVQATLLRATIGRQLDVAGRVDERGERVGRPVGEQARLDRIDKVKCFVNWDTRRNALVHYEHGCGQCNSREDAIANVYAAIIEGRVLPDTTCTVPSKHRFGSAMDALSEQIPGLLISDLTKRCFDHAFPSYNASDAVPADENGDDQQVAKYQHTLTPTPPHDM